MVFKFTHETDLSLVIQSKGVAHYFLYECDSSLGKHGIQLHEILETMRST